MTIQDQIDTDDSLAMVLTVGNTASWFLDVVQADVTTPYDLSGATVLHISFKENASVVDGDPEEIFEKDLLGDPNHDLVNGRISISIDPGDLTDDMDGVYNWDIRVVTPSLGTFNAPQPMGNVIIRPRVRRTD